MRPVSFNLQLEKSNFLSLVGFYYSEITLAKYASTSSPRKFLLQVKIYILQNGNISHNAWNPAGPISFNEISNSFKEVASFKF